ncbi:unnamed protein product [Penicillium salamii]|uniref:Protein kinase domain-containing protein n=1 Tax=Penicillium salamii TaxID=1612424 RepID=A0A9W4JNX3_9EURO|nr:unnamed protein product [Penicillium salamii]
MSLEDICKALASAKYNKDTPTKSFILYEDVQQIWAGEKLEQFLWTHDPSLTPSEIDTVRENLLRTISVIATIVPSDWLRWSRFREMFLPADDTLANFRRDKHALDFKMEDLAVDSFLGGDHLAQLFMIFRWIYFPEVLKGREQVDYEPERRIPLYREMDSAPREGVFGTVTKERIPPNYIVLSHLSDHLGIPDAPHPVELVVARKSFRKPNTHFFDEVNALKNLRASLSTHKRIVSYLAIFSIHNQWNIIMPWADMDLEEFLVKGYETMEATSCLLQDLICESRNLAAAIHFLHEHLHLESEWPEFHDQAMCHMDLKPRNILVFKQPGSSTGIWKITDFGISQVAHLRQSEDSTQDSGYTHMGRRPSLRMGEYHAPDIEVQLRSDIWSFGCILTRVFALGLDPASLKEVDKQRKENLTGGRQDDCFHVGTPPVLHPSIESWIEGLPNKYSAILKISSTDEELQGQPDNQSQQSYNPEFLEEIQKIFRSMLQINFERRPSAREVRSALHSLQEINIYINLGKEPRKPSTASGSTLRYLVYAIKENSMQELHDILSEPLDVEDVHNGERPLIYAINLANATAINELSNHQRIFRRNLDVRTCSSEGYTPLHLAVRTGNLSIVKAVIDASIPPPSPEFAVFLNEMSSGTTALMQAAFLGHADVVSLLLSQGADHTICTGEDNWNCLHYAVIYENRAKEDVIKAFNKKMAFDQLPPGASEGISYETPLLHHLNLALLGDVYGNRKINSMWIRKFNALLEGGADLNRKFNAGTPLETSPLEAALVDKNETIVRILLDAKATPRATLPVNYRIPSWLYGELRKKVKKARTAQPSPRY